VFEVPESEVEWVRTEESMRLTSDKC